ncbi:MAG: DUF962 domain-containing protein [Myxococcota bacterium]
MSHSQPTTFSEFWPYYMGEHAKPATRAFHVFGTTIAVGLLVWAVAFGHWMVLPAAIVSGYFFAWVSHFFIEKNRPATFTYPLWSLAADFKLWAMTLTLQIGPELDRLGLRHSKTAET